MSPAPAATKRFPVPAQIAAVAAALVLVAAAGYFMLVAPKKNELKDARAQAAQLQQQLSAGESESATASAQSKIKVADAFRLTKAMPESTDVGAIILELSALAEQAGIRFDSLRPEDLTPLNGFEVLPIDVVFQGSFWELSDFLGRLRSLVLVHKQELEAQGRLFTVDKLAFAQGEGGFPQISATLTIDAYVYSASAISPSATGTTGTTTTSTSTTSTTSTGAIASALGGAPDATSGQGA
jgi:Tfp pilus assembly protein PilO